MSENLPQWFVVRHAGTAWSVAHQHTGRSDIPLSPHGEEQARALYDRLHDLQLAEVFCSPLQRARRTCELAGFAQRAVIDNDLCEWDYGQYEGRTTAEIRRQRPGWDLFRDGVPRGESLADVVARADRFIARVRAVDDHVLAFGSAHVLRVMAARWMGLTGEVGRNLFLSPASVSVLGYEHDRGEPTVKLWNDCSHLGIEALLPVHEVLQQQQQQ